MKNKKIIDNTLLKDFIQWDIDSWKEALFYWENSCDWDTVNYCLELGGRQGGLSLWLALKGKKVICSDLKNTQQTAEKLHSKFKTEGLITYMDIDATNIPFENYFDVIVFKSIIGGIGAMDNYPLQEKVFSEIHKALKPGGKLLFAENLYASPFHSFMRRQFVSWGQNWRYLTLTELLKMLGVFKNCTSNTTGVIAVFGRTEKQKAILYKIDSLVLNRICPKNWNYIAYGFATK